MVISYIGKEILFYGVKRIDYKLDEYLKEYKKKELEDGKVRSTKRT